MYEANPKLVAVLKADVVVSSPLSRPAVPLLLLVPEVTLPTCTVLDLAMLEREGRLPPLMVLGVVEDLWISASEDLE